MLDTIVLLTGPTEQSPLADVLLGHNPRLTVYHVETAAALAALDPQLLARARLIAFMTGVIVPARIIAQLGYGAYNFHPGSPRYPGWAPAHFAIYRQAKVFGATAHVMIEQVDAGPIIGVESFPVPPDISVAGLEGLAYAHLAHLFWRLAKSLAAQTEPLPTLAVRWSGQKTSRRLYLAMCDVPLDVSKEELDRRVKAFSNNNLGVRPTIHLDRIQAEMAARDSSPPIPGDPAARTAAPAY